MQTKVCSCCHTEKPITEFYKKIRNKDGLDTMCITCNREYQEKRKKLNIQYEPKNEGYKECYICHKILSIINFSVDRRLADGRTNRCKQCISKYNKNYKIQNKDKIREYAKYYDVQIISKKCIVCGNTYQGKRNGTNFCPDCHSKRRTLPELDFINLLNQFNIKYEVEYHIGNYNYDFYLPEYNLLVEISPSYSHSTNPIGYISKGKDKFYHFNKVNFANTQGYDCINIWDWLDKSSILAYLKKNSKLNIFKREIKEHNDKDLIVFDDGQDIRGI